MHLLVFLNNFVCVINAENIELIFEFKMGGVHLVVWKF